MSLSQSSIYVAFFVGAVLLWSSAAKLTMARETALSLVAFRIARRIRLGAARMFAAGEGALGVSLILSATFRPGALRELLGVAGALLAGFVIVIARSLRRGDSFPCMCFGSREGSVSRLTLLRAGALMSVSIAADAVAVITGTPGIAPAAALASLFACTGCLAILALAMGVRRVGRRLDPFHFGDRDALVPDGLSLLGGQS